MVNFEKILEEDKKFVDIAKVVKRTSEGFNDYDLSSFASGRVSYGDVMYFKRMIIRVFELGVEQGKKGDVDE